MMHRPRSDTAFRALLLASVVLLLASCAPRYHRVKIVDAQTGRGIPLVELKTTHDLRYYTDSAGVAAIDAGSAEHIGALFLFAASHGYEIKREKFGFHGFGIYLRPGGSTTVAMSRINVAERLYRITGEGIYRDSVLLGDRVPLRKPLLAGGVMGQDSANAVIYRGKLYWSWGDTRRAGHPLGNLKASGATSELPGQGGLDPDLGIDFDYFVGPNGFSRAICPIEGPGPVWITGVMVIEHEGRERMLCHYSRMRELGVRREHGIAMWNDETEEFEKLRRLPDLAPLHPSSHPVRVTEDGEDWFYFPNPFPATRVRATLEDILDPARYEAYTCLRTGAPWNSEAPELERDEEGRLVWGWKADTAAIAPKLWQELVDRGLVEWDEGWMNLRDVRTDDRVIAHSGSLSWNEYRKKWILLALESQGHSPLGEVWYAESDGLLGPWDAARKIVSHERYSFYNIKQHPYFAEEGGRFIYFEGTYTGLFSGNPDHTPRYNYNQIMYRLDLDDPRLEGVQ